MNTKPSGVVVAGDTCVSAQGLAVIVGRDKRYQVCGSAHGFYDAGELIRNHQPDVLLIEPFLEDRDGIWWIKDLATEFPRTRDADDGISQYISKLPYRVGTNSTNS
jgi:response regulator of citrate/malate metabolism